MKKEAIVRKRPSTSSNDPATWLLNVANNIECVHNWSPGQPPASYRCASRDGNVSLFLSSTAECGNLRMVASLSAAVEGNSPLDVPTGSRGSR